MFVCYVMLHKCRLSCYLPDAHRCFQAHLFNLKMTARQLDKLSKNCDKEEKNERLKLKKDLMRGNGEGARIHAESAIRQVPLIEYLNFFVVWTSFMTSPSPRICCRNPSRLITYACRLASMRWPAVCKPRCQWKRYRFEIHYIFYISLLNVWSYFLQVTGSMKGVVQCMEKAMQSMNIEQVSTYAYVLIGRKYWNVLFLQNFTYVYLAHPKI